MGSRLHEGLHEFFIDASTQLPNWTTRLVTFKIMCTVQLLLETSFDRPNRKRGNEF